MTCRGHSLSLFGCGEAVDVVVFRFMRRCYCVLSQRPSRYPYRKSMRKGLTVASLGLPVLREVLTERAQEAAGAASALVKAQPSGAAAA